MSQPAPTPSAPPTAEAARETFQEFLSGKGLRVTSQRLAIFEAAYGTDDHFTAEELLTSAREIDRSVSRATVYRTLPILTESGLVREIDVGRDYKFYLASRGQQVEQAQIVCADCEKIWDVDAPFLEWYAKSIASRFAHEPLNSRLQVTARCLKLDREKGTCPLAEGTIRAAR